MIDLLDPQTHTFTIENAINPMLNIVVDVWCHLSIDEDADLVIHPASVAITVGGLLIHDGMYYSEVEDGAEKLLGGLAYLIKKRVDALDESDFGIDAREIANDNADCESTERSLMGRI